MLGRTYTLCEREPVRVPVVVPSPRTAVLPELTDCTLFLEPDEPCTTRPIEERRTEDDPRLPATSPDARRV